MNYQPISVIINLAEMNMVSISDFYLFFFLCSRVIHIIGKAQQNELILSMFCLHALHILCFCCTKINIIYKKKINEIKIIPRRVANKMCTTYIGYFPHSNVKTLDLSNNNMAAIGAGFFRPIDNSIIRLVLSHNKLTVII